MTLLCGTDFSTNASRAAVAAGWLAARLREPLTLVHVCSDPEGSRPQAEAQLEREVSALMRRCGADVTPLVTGGKPAQRLVELAVERDAQMLIVSSLGASKKARWLLGSVAERVAAHSPVPTLVIRDEEVFERWAQDEAALRILVGVEPRDGLEATLRWAEALRAVAPCSLSVGQIAWPAEEQTRAEVPPPIPLDRLRPELEAKLLEELRRWAEAAQPDGAADDAPGNPTRFIVRAGWGRVDAHLLQLAKEEATDLLVVGTHRRAVLDRLWKGSVSRAVLHEAPMSVAVLPWPAPH